MVMIHRHSGTVGEVEMVVAVLAVTAEITSTGTLHESVVMMVVHGRDEMIADYL